MNAIKLNPDSHLFLLYTVVRGIRTHSEEISEETIGQTRETRREVTETIADVHEAARAKALRNKIRTCGAKYCSTIHSFTVSDPARIAAFQVEVGPLLDAVRLHNAVAKFHPVEVEFTPVPLAQSLSAATAQGIYQEIGRRLDAAKDHVQRGDTASIDAWVKRNRSLGAFLAAAQASVLDDACNELKGASSELKSLIRGDEEKGIKPLTPEDAGAIVGPKLYTLDTARGLVASSAPAVATIAPLAGVA